MNKIILVIALLAAHLGQAAAYTGEFLRMDSPTAAALGGAQAALEGTPAIFGNPAAVGSDSGAYASYKRLPAGLNAQFIGGHRPVGVGVIFASVRQLSYGKADTYDNVGTRTGSSKPSDTVIGVGYTLLTCKTLRAGVGLKFTRLDYGESASGEAGDAGLYWQYAEKAALGLVFSNLTFRKVKFGMEGESLPSAVRVGGRYGFGRLKLSADLERQAGSSKTNWYAGAELYRPIGDNTEAALKAGWKSTARVVSLGASLILSNSLSLDYAYVPLAFGPSHEMAITFRVP